MGLLAMAMFTNSQQHEKPLICRRGAVKVKHRLIRAAAATVQESSHMKGIGQEATQKTSFLTLTFQTNYFRGALHSKTLGSD